LGTGESRKPIETIGLFVSLHRENARDAAVPFVERLCQSGVRVLASPEVAEGTGIACDVLPQEQVVHADLVIVFGGDGSLLHTAARAAPLGVPVLGVDMGSFGFLADSRLEALYKRLDDVLQGEFEIEERLMLQAGVSRRGEELGPWPGLNDAVTGVLSYSHVARFAVSLDDDQVASYAADGLIVATPTGSTAYSLAAGGPVIEPEVESFVITPICPHTLRSRPVVVSPDTVIAIEMRESDRDLRDVHLAVDGSRYVSLKPGDRVVVKKADFRARLARVGATTFYSRLRDKLSWGVSQ
jgi:NAD+ kinase